MADEENDLILPELDEHDTAAVIGLLIRVMRIDIANTRERELVAELNAALAQRVPVRKKYLEGIGAFGFNTTKSDIWDSVKAAIGPKTYSNAWAIARAASEASEQKAKELEEQPDVAQGARSKVGPSLIGSDDHHRDKSDQQIPKIGQAILEYLRSLHGLGAPVSVIKKHLSDTYGIETHEKTPGMTLYRLSKEGLVRRDGRSWFATDVVGNLEASRASSADSGIGNGE